MLTLRPLEVEGGGQELAWCPMVSLWDVTRLGVHQGGIAMSEMAASPALLPPIAPPLANYGFGRVVQPWHWGYT